MLRSYKEFVKEFWECIPGAGKLVWSPHLDVFCEELQRAMERVFIGLPREYDLIFNVPFGTSKTSLISVLSQGWGWARKPDLRFLSATHTDSLAQDIASRAKDVVTSEKYRSLFPEIVIRQDRSAKTDYANTAGGERKSCTVGGKTPTGRHSHIILVDDPIDPQGARSELELDTAAKFMREVIPSRAVDKALTPTILVMQRLSPRDPTAVMLETAKVEGAIPVRQISLPGEITDKITPPEYRDIYVDGLLDPVRMPRNVLNSFKAKLGAYAYAGQVLQEPVPPGGGMFKPQWFNRRVRAAPYQATRVRYWDRAATQDGGCYTAGVLISRDSEGSYYVEHVVHGQWDPDERNEIIHSTALRDRARYGPNHTPLIVIEAERGSTGLESYRNIVRKLAGFRVQEDQPTGSKDVRAEPWATQLAAGNVLMVEDGTWDIAGYVEEHILFRPDPTTKRLGKYKDQVDASSGAFNMLVVGPKREGSILRVLNVGGKKQKGLRLYFCSRIELETIIVEERCLLVSIEDLAGGRNGVQGEPATDIQTSYNETLPPGHSLNKLLDSLTLTFADIAPEEHQEKWNEPVPPYGRPPADLIMKPEHGKKLWSFLLKKRDPGPEVIVFCDDGDRRAKSVALSVVDAMRLPRKEHVFNLVDSYNVVIGDKDVPSNNHVYSVTKTARGMVI